MSEMTEITVLNYLTTPRHELIAALAERDGYVCRYCPEPFVEVDPNPLFCTVDHYHSQDFGKQNGWTVEQIHGIDNLVLAHRKCNAAKGARRWTEEGTLEPRTNIKQPKLPRPETCETCANGRLLLAGEVCDMCGSGPQPATAPKYLQREPKDCDHDQFLCWMCFIGHVPRVTSLEVLIKGHRSDG